MDFGIVSALSGARAKELELEMLANNIANMQTTGYKEMSVSFNSELQKFQSSNKDLAQAQAAIKDGTTYINFAQGGSFRTNNPTDVAIQGEGFFSIQTPDGIRYTRDGSFSLNSEGALVNAQGHTVLSNSGPLTIPQGATIHIGSSGDVSVNDEIVGKLQVVDFVEKDQLKPAGTNYYNAEGLTEREDFKTNVVQGHLENSNVSLVNNMTRIIQVSRAYESLQKSIKQQISASKMLNQLARIG